MNGFMTRNKISVFGLWHLGSVISACLADYHEVMAYDSDISVYEAGNIPVEEPNLREKIQKNKESGRLVFSNDINSACEHSNVLWIAYDTSVDENDNLDLQPLIADISLICALKKTAATIIISSQIPTGTCALFEKTFPRHKFVYVPENLQLGQGIDTFTGASRFIVGVRDAESKELLTNILNLFGRPLIFVNTESAEMIKHALNSFLATSVVFANEIGKLCRKTGANPDEVAMGLKTDIRIGPKAYVNSGAPFAGGTLARDVKIVNKFALENKEETPLLFSIIKSNNIQKNWYLDSFDVNHTDTILLLGLSYTKTDTLRRSLALEIVDKIREKNPNIKFTAYDYFVKNVPEKYKIKQFQDINFTDLPDVVLVFGSKRNVENFNLVRLRGAKKIIFIDPARIFQDKIVNFSNIVYKF